YSRGDGIFRSPPWMKILLRNEDDPLEILNVAGKGTSGVVNIIDLANIYSCSFIATDDAGKLYPDGSFEILGRIDNSDIRGCSLMAV
ncbi:MAG TPA: acyl transferase, partial [Agriterribacter sp.]|nr:acyl transferase [Agriterribacter sp.]